MIISTRQSEWKRAAICGALATEMGLATAGGLVFGYVLDQYFKTEPILTIVFFFFGLAGGVITFIQLWKFLKEKI